MRGPLEDFRVIDLCRAGPGQMATGILADYGADVITIVEPGYAERSAAGDMGRRRLGALNRRNKRSIFLNMRAEESRDVFLRLAQSSHALLESNRPGVAKRLGVDYESVKKINPHIVYCSLSGFGQTGPYANIAAHDLSFQGVAGMIPLDEEDKPFIPPYNQADINAIFFGAIAVLIGLLGASKNAQGQYIDVAFSDVSTTVPPGRMGDEMLRGHYPCYNIYETKDGRYLTLSIREPWFWERLCKLLSREDWTPHIRPEGQLKEEMFHHFRRTFKSKTLAEWVKTLTEQDIEFGPVNTTVEQLRQDPHIQARQMLLETNDPITGQARYEAGFLMKFLATPAQVWRGPTPMGADTEAVLQELGYSAAQQAHLKGAGVIA